MTWTRSHGAGAAQAALARRAVRWGAGGVAVAAAVAAGLAGAPAAMASPAIPIPVPCSVTALNLAITLSPANSILVLKPGCVYVTATPLSNVTKNLTISGSNDVIRFIGTGTILHVLGVNLDVSQLTFTGGNGVGTEPGAIHNLAGTVTLTSTRFRDNTGGDGGAIENDNGGHLIIKSSTFAENHARDLGGAIDQEHASVTGIDATTFFGNSSDGNGGAIENDTNSNTLFSPTTAGKSTFRDNTADGFGGAVRNFNGTVDVTNVDFAGNHATDDGGAVSNIGGTSNFTNSGFEGNSGRNGGAIQTTKALNLVGDSISGNRATLRGGGLYVNGGSTTLSQNTLVFGNFAGISGGGIFRNSGTVTLTTGSSVTLNIPNNCTGVIC
jgi:predicted outer membrane repeat protein